MPTQTDRIAEGPRARSDSPARHLGAGIALALALAAAGCGGGNPAPKFDTPQFDTPYQAVFMANGQVFFGKLSGLGTENPRLDEVFYVQQQVNPETKQATNVLIRRGGEWHAPSYMVLNARSVLLIEPVGADSKVAQLIAEAQKAPAAKP
jgi:hypothetical protein